MKRHVTRSARVRVVVLAAIVSLFPGAGAMAQDAASPAPSEAASAIAQASPSPEGSPTASSITDTPDVTMLGSVFHPVTIEVTAGETVDWFNDDVTVHTVTALDGSFNSGVMVIGATFSVAFETPGTFDYICAIHPLMTGSVIVSA